MLRKLVGQQANDLIVQVRSTSARVATNGDRCLLAQGQNESRTAESVHPVGRLRHRDTGRMEREALPEIPIANSAQCIHLQVLAIDDSIANLRCKQRFRYVKIDRSLPQISYRKGLIVP